MVAGTGSLLHEGVLTELALTRLALHIIRRYLQLSDCMLGLSGMPGWRHSAL